MSDSTLNWCIGCAALVNLIIAIKIGIDDGVVQPAVGWLACAIFKLAGAL